MINENSFSTAFSFIRSLFVSVISYMNKLTIFGGISVLDFNIALLIFGAILPIVIITVKNWSNGEVTSFNTARKSEATFQRHRKQINNDYLKRHNEYNRH